MSDQFDKKVRILVEFLCLHFADTNSAAKERLRNGAQAQISNHNLDFTTRTPKFMIHERNLKEESRDPYEKI